MDIIDRIVKNRFLGGEIEAHHSYKPIVEYINNRTPTAYGSVRFVDVGPTCLIALEDHASKDAILKLISKNQHGNNYDIDKKAELDEFVQDGEVFLKVLYGGSAGQILLLKNAEGGHFVRKVAARFGVEGNGSPKLRAEINYLLAIQKMPKSAGLVKLYPHVINHAETERYIILDQEYVGEGKNVFTLLSQGKITAPEHIHHMNVLLSSLIPDGYNLDSRFVPTEESLQQLEDYYLRRAEGRIRYLENCGSFKMDFPSSTHTSLPEIVSRRTITINGIDYMNPLNTIKKIRSTPMFAERVRPRTESFCAHGDMTFLNMVFDNRSMTYRLIDNRGRVGNWDALYDFGKLKFTLSGFGNIMLKNFTLAESKDENFTLKLTGGETGKSIVDSLNSSFLDYLYDNEHFRHLIKDEPYWQERILFAEAMHYLSDIPHRLLLDQSPEHAVAVFLLGTQYLHELLKSLMNE